MRNILLVEDNITDGQFIKQTFNDINKYLNIEIVNDVEAAMNYLQTNPPFQKAIMPDLIILDLMNPCLKIVEFIKSDAALRRIPVIILSSSSDQEYINKCCFNFANAFIIKPKEKERFIEIINAIDNFWFKQTTLSSIPK
jgi:CheY-like chemotaxis protein